MEQTLQPGHQHEDGQCNAASCSNCYNCKVVKLEERRSELKTGAPQLYGKEAEYYSFYYALNLRQSS